MPIKGHDVVGTKSAVIKKGGGAGKDQSNKANLEGHLGTEIGSIWKYRKAWGCKNPPGQEGEDDTGMRS